MTTTVGDIAGDADLPVDRITGDSAVKKVARRRSGATMCRSVGRDQARDCRRGALHSPARPRRLCLRPHVPYPGVASGVGVGVAVVGALVSIGVGVVPTVGVVVMVGLGTTAAGEVALAARSA